MRGRRSWSSWAEIVAGDGLANGARRSTHCDRLGGLFSAFRAELADAVRVAEQVQVLVKLAVPANEVHPNAGPAAVDHTGFSPLVRRLVAAFLIEDIQHIQLYGKRRHTERKVRNQVSWHGGIYAEAKE